MDFIKQYPSMTLDDFFWRYSGPMVRLMCMDGTSVRYLSEKQAKKLSALTCERQYTDLDQFGSDLGIL